MYSRIPEISPNFFWIFAKNHIVSTGINLYRCYWFLTNFEFEINTFLFLTNYFMYRSFQEGMFTFLSVDCNFTLKMCSNEKIVKPVFNISLYIFVTVNNTEKIERHFL